MKENSRNKKIPEGKYAINNKNESDSDEEKQVRTSSAKMLSTNENFLSSQAQGELMSSSEEDDDLDKDSKPVSNKNNISNQNYHLS